MEFWSRLLVLLQWYEERVGLLLLLNVGIVYAQNEQMNE